MKNYANFEQSKFLHNKGIDFGEPQIGDVYWIVHPDTDAIDNVVVGSAKWHIVMFLDKYRAPSLSDLLKQIGGNYSVRCGDWWQLMKSTKEGAIAYHGENPIDLILKYAYNF